MAIADPFDRLRGALRETNQKSLSGAESMTRRAAVIGAGPNGLAAAVVLQRAGVEVTLYESNAEVGGGARTEELTLPGFRHDVGSSVYPMGFVSPVFRSMPLERYGVRWVEPEAPLAHPLEGGAGDGAAVMLGHTVEETAQDLDGVDRAAWRGLFGPLVEYWEELAPELLGPVLHVPRHPLLLARFGAGAVLPATVLATTLFRGERARALLAGMAAHAVLPLERPLSAAVALVLGTAGQATGWPVIEGGASRLSEGLRGYFESLGGRVLTGLRVGSLREVDGADVVLCDVPPGALVRMAEGTDRGLTESYGKLLRRYRHGPGTFKVDWALREPIPWRDARALRAATVHVGGTLDEVARSERAPWRGEVDARPFVLVTQPSVTDATRAPAGRHTAWGYMHTPNGWTGDATEAIEGQMERFAPGFRECVLARHTMGCAALEAWNANLVGGDLSGGAMTAWQTAMRPTPDLYSTSRAGVYLCSSSTPPGGGVHGMCGMHAAERALAWLGSR